MGRQTHVCKDICKSLASALLCCILNCLRPFRMALNNSYVKLISIVYRGLGERKSAQTIDSVQRYSKIIPRLRNGAEHLFPASEWRWTIIQRHSFGSVCLVSDKLECKKLALKQVISKYRCKHVSANTLNRPATYNFSRSFFWYQIQPISISWDAPFNRW